MERSEFEKKTKGLGLEKIHKLVISSKKIYYYADKARSDIYGVSRTKDKKYCVFFNSLERDISKTLAEFETEQEAFEFLYQELLKTKGNNNG